MIFKAPLFLWFLCSVVLLLGCAPSTQPGNPQPLPTSTLRDNPPSSEALRLLTATTMSATVTAPITTDAYPSPMTTNSYPAPLPAESYPAPSIVVPLNTPAPPPLPPSPTPPVYAYPLPPDYPTPTPFPAHPVTADALPPVTHDLLFVQDGILMRWNHATNRIEPLTSVALVRQRTPLAQPLLGFGGFPPGWVDSFTVSPDGQWVMVREVVNGPVSQIVRLDLNTGARQILVENIVGSAALTQDGRWVLYEPQGPEYAEDEVDRFLVATDGSSESHLIVPCNAPSDATAAPCYDEAGFWWTDETQGTRGTRLLLRPSSTSENSTIAEFMPAWGLYDATQWSPSGRYRIVRVPGVTEGAGWAVLDTGAGQQAEIPNSFYYIGDSPQLRWVSNDHLLMTDLTQVILWRVESGDSVTLNSTILFALDAAQQETSITSAPAELKDGRLAFAVMGRSESGLGYPSDSPFSALFTIPPQGGNATRLNTLPTSFSNVWWVPDGSGALAESHNWSYQEPIRHMLYLPADGTPPYDLGAVIPPQAAGFTWVPSP